MSRLLLLMALQNGEAKPEALVVERKAHWRILDPVNRATEIERMERVTIQGQRIRIEDLTFGTITVIRLDQKRVIRMDRSLRTYSEATFEQVAAARKAFLEEIARVKERVKGTADQESLERIERGFQAYDVASAVLAPTGRKETALGRELAEHQLLVNGKIQILRGLLDESIPEGETYWRGLCAASCFGPNVAPAVEKIKGFPARGTFRLAWFRERVEADEQAQSARRELVADDIFEAPKDWKRVPLAGVEPEPARAVPVPDALRPGK